MDECEEISIDIGPACGLAGRLARPPAARALVLFAHGSGSSRHSPRNQGVARQLHRRGLATLLFDLLTPAEAADRDCVFDIGLLSERLALALDWAGAHAGLSQQGCGLFGASTGAAAALTLAARRPERIGAVVSRGGRVDLCLEPLSAVRAPVLLLVGELDRPVLELNRAALERLGADASRLQVVAGAGHLFEEAGTLDQVAAAAAGWFEHHLCGGIEHG